MILYHGTNIDFDTINLTKSHKYKDFGQGFYLTDIRKQAEELASKRSRLFGGYPVIQEYEFDEKLLEEGELRVLKFDRPSEEWADFIFKNRNRETNYIHDYDIVIGPIADDGVAYLLGLYDEGVIKIGDLSKRLEYKNLNRQYFFGTEKSLKYLKRL
ncbi:MAG: DUF3990 domain-containing protein [Paludibacteraceae bacterium]|jgi:hypothetical protein|nr:DUF3990 domain-containing protein [Paludibacteraceae bacterium]